MSGSSMIDRSKLEAAWIGFSTIFNMALEAVMPKYIQIATVLPSTNPVEQYKWMGDLPLLKKWIGERQIAKLAGETQTIENEDWAIGIEVDRNDIRDDRRLGIVVPRIQGLAQVVGRRIDAEVVDRLVNGFDGTYQTAYDGQFLFDTDHTAAGNGTGTSQDNTGTEVLSAANYEAAVATMMGFTDAEDEPIDVFPTILLVGPSNRVTARSILKQKILASGEQNMNEGEVALMVHPRITGPEWFLMDTSKSVRTIIVQIYQDAQFVALDSMDDYLAFMSKKLLYGVDASFGVGPGFWQTAYGSTGSP